MSKTRRVVLGTLGRECKYDRYLADVFVNGVYVNQQLVEKGFAVIVEE